MFIIQIASSVLVRLKFQNLFLSHFYFILQFILLSIFYYKLLNFKFQKNVIKYSLIIVIPILVIQYILDISKLHKFNLPEILITSILTIIYCTFYLYEMLSDKKKYYYITIGVLIYLFGSTIVFLTANLLISKEAKITFKYIWDFNVYLYIIYQLIILYELVKINSKTVLNAKFD